MAACVTGVTGPVEEEEEEEDLFVFNVGHDTKLTGDPITIDSCITDSNLTGDPRSVFWICLPIAAQIIVPTALGYLQVFPI